MAPMPAPGFGKLLGTVLAVQVAPRSVDTNKALAWPVGQFAQMPSLELESTPPSFWKHGPVWSLNGPPPTEMRACVISPLRNGPSASTVTVPSWSTMLGCEAPKAMGMATRDQLCAPVP